MGVSGLLVKPGKPSRFAKVSRASVVSAVSTETVPYAKQPCF